jgi:Septum formation
MWEPEQREADRYPKAGLRQRAEDFVGWFPSHRNGTAAIAIVVGLLILYRVLTPGFVRLGDVRPGDCLFVRTVAATSTVDPGPGDPASVGEALRRGAAEPASCDLSHSHEVSGLVDLAADAVGAAPPAFDAPALLAFAEQACAPHLASYLGLAPGVASTTYVGFAVIPDEGEWQRGTRVAACLLASADGHFLTARARGTGR